jgi:hypothetical protein
MAGLNLLLDEILDQLKQNGPGEGGAVARVADQQLGDNY